VQEQQRRAARAERDREVLRVATDFLAAESEIVTLTLARRADPSSLVSTLPTFIERTTLMRAHASSLRLLVNDRAVLQGLDALGDALAPTAASSYAALPGDEAEAVAAAAIRAREAFVAALRTYLDRPD
jgi:hypothetical protein